LFLPATPRGWAGGGASGRQQRSSSLVRARWGGPLVVSSHQEFIQWVRRGLVVLADGLVELGKQFGDGGGMGFRLRWGKQARGLSGGPFIRERGHAVMGQ
jgi:hypothetical protein